MQPPKWLGHHQSAEHNERVILATDLSGRANLDRYLSAYPVLQALYAAKQRLTTLLLIKTGNARRVKRALPKLLTLLQHFVNSPAKTLASTLLSWLEPIVGMWRYPTSSGITEGCHTKAEMMSRRAFGCRNFENYQSRVLAHCGWDGVINRI